ncbi:hypothetical protein HYV84_08265 [Candidatus Woesearchaeota archaeon]|nr:hypothetical protein [Candidatus Woesearchaeota archaeon]
MIIKKKVLTLGLALALVILAVFQTIQIFGLQETAAGSNTITGNAAASGGKLDMSGWTENEKMNYEHHQTLPARLQNGASSGASQGRIDMSGWTENEKMNYEHHGTLPARLRTSQGTPQGNSNAQAQMVGGC